MENFIPLDTEMPPSGKGRSRIAGLACFLYEHKLNFICVNRGHAYPTQDSSEFPDCARKNSPEEIWIFNLANTLKEANIQCHRLWSKHIIKYATSWQGHFKICTIKHLYYTLYFVVNTSLLRLNFLTSCSHQTTDGQGT
jgi:hypothetical protein